MTSSSIVTFCPMANPITFTPFGFSRNFCFNLVSSSLDLKTSEMKTNETMKHNLQIGSKTLNWFLTHRISAALSSSSCSSCNLLRWQNFLTFFDLKTIGSESDILIQYKIDKTSYVPNVVYKTQQIWQFIVVCQICSWSHMVVSLWLTSLSHRFVKCGWSYFDREKSRKQSVKLNETKRLLVVWLLALFFHRNFRAFTHRTPKTTNEIGWKLHQLVYQNLVRSNRIDSKFLE